jgi:hypothetical protein
MRDERVVTTMQLRQWMSTEKNRKKPKALRVQLPPVKEIKGNSGMSGS